MEDVEKVLAWIRRSALKARKRDTFGRFDDEKDEPRDTALNIRLTQSERDAIRKAAAASGMTITRLVNASVRYYTATMERGWTDG